MKYSQLAEMLSVSGLIAACFLPWSYIADKHIIISGVQTAGTEFGKPGLLTIIFSVFLLLFFFIRKIWSKKINIIVAAFNMAWSIRNYLLVTACFMGDCPEKKPGIYLVLIFSFIIFIMTLLPKADIKISS